MSEREFDIVLYGERVIKGDGNLEVPRAELLQTFVLQPLVDIAPDALHPTLHKSIAELWASAAASGGCGSPVDLAA